MSQVNKHRRQLLRYLGGIGAVSLAGCLGSQGEGEYPNEQIRMIVAFSSGGGTDVYARKVWTAASDVLGVEVQIENVPGAGGMRGAQDLYRSDPDGYTLAAYNIPGDIVTAIVQKPGFQFDEFEGIAAHAKNVLLLIGNPNEEIKGFEGMAQRYRDGELKRIGGMQEGTQLHILANVMKTDDEYNVAWEDYIPYDGSGPVGQAVASGEAPVGIVTEPTARDLQDRIDPIASLSTRGSNVFPELTSPADAGYPDIDYVGEVTRAFYAPPETKQDILDVLSSAVKKSIQSDELQSWSSEAGLDLEYYGGHDLVENATKQAINTIPEMVNLNKLDS